MTPEERQLLSALFDRMRGVADQPRDREAEAFIADALRQQPYAPYLLAQTVLVQEEALRAAAARIQELEEGSAARREQASFLPGRGSVPRTGAGTAPPQPQDQGPWGQPAMGASPPSGPWNGAGNAPAGGGFLRNAMAAAAGVAGGALLYQGIQNLFGSHGSGQAAGLFGTAGAQPGDTSFADKFVGTGKPETNGDDDKDLTEASYDDGDDGDDDEDDDGGFDGGSDDSGWA
jgi:hypothetical protein